MKLDRVAVDSLLEGDGFELTVPGGSIRRWRKRARVAKGRRSIARLEDVKTASARSFCSRCGTPLLYERKSSPHMVNIPRALFTGRVGREPRYHVAI